MPLSIEMMSPASVTSRTAVDSRPASMRRPLMPTENSPETGLAPECTPTALETSTPCSMPAITSASGVAAPSTMRLVGRTCGMLRYEERKPLPVDCRPALRAVYTS